MLNAFDNNRAFVRNQSVVNDIDMEKITSLSLSLSHWLLLKLSKLIRPRREENLRFRDATREVADGEKIAKMVNDKVGPSQFRKLRFPSKDDNPQKLDNRVKELFKELVCHGIWQTLFGS